ncbi:MAG: SMC family ATPase, partial [Anaerolineae bacterium]|nr:SMC family ATPase [Anaerolineae bacterium]
MWITKLQLSDIKSYGPDSLPIHFARGVNLIQGRNGAGKSTILEAIGLALFNSNPYSLSQLVREGAKRGTVTVGFVSAVEDREYEIVRGVGGGQTYVYDPETERRVCEGVKDTAQFIREHLGVDDEIDLATLFRDAVGVPQGTITAIFQQPAAARKATFDPLLRVEEFDTAWNRLLETSRYIDTRIAANENRRAELRGVLADLPAVQEELARLDEQVQAGQDSLGVTTARLDELAARLQAFVARKMQLDGLDAQLQERRVSLRVLENSLAAAETDVQEAQAAAQSVAASAAGHAAYEQAQQTLDALEGARTERDTLTGDRHGLTTDLKLCQGEVDRLADRLAEVEAAAAQVEALAAQVAQQEELEAEVTRAGQEQAAYARLAEDLVLHDERLDEQTRQLDGLQTRAAALGVALTVGVTYTVPADTILDDEAEAASKGVWRLEAACEQLDGALAELVGVKREWSGLQADLDQRRATQERLDVASAQREAAQVQADAARLRAAQIAQALDQLGRYADLLAGADARCPVCRQPLGEHAREESAAHFADERARLVEEQTTVQDELETLQADLAAHGQICDTLRADLDRLPGEAARAPVQERLDRAQAAVDEQRAAVAAAWEQAGRAQYGFVALLSVFRDEVEAMAGAAERLEESQAQLTTLGDPRRAYDRAKSTADERPTVAAALAGQQERAADLQARLDELDVALAQFADLDARMAAARSERTANEPAHQQYLANRDAAARLDDRLAARDDLLEQVAALEVEISDVAATRAEMAADYDAAAHAALDREQRQLEQTQAE